MASDNYLGPRTIERHGKGMGAWIWVTPGVPQPLPDWSADDSASEGDGRLHSATSGTRGSGSGRELIGSWVTEMESSDGSPPRRLNEEGVRINVLGPVEMDPALVPANRAVLLELACYLALHRNGVVSTEVLQMALPLSRRGVSGAETAAKTIRTYMSELRGYLGPENVPSARGSGYRLSDLVTCDWELFRALSNERVSDPHEQMRPLSEALNLIRGRPFDGTKFRWVDAELWVSDMEGAIADVARRLGELATALEVPGVVWFAGRRAVLACPYDTGLWAMALEGAAGYDAKELKRTWHDAQVALGDESSALDDVAKRLGLR